MENQQKKQYEVPQLTVVTFKTEQGYATSGPNSLGMGSGKGSKSLEDRQDGGNWGGTDGWF